MGEEKKVFRAGFVAIMGAPNAGKSTLINRLTGEKIAITSRKPQTTRSRILGIVHRPSAQLALVDTPGIHQASKVLNRRIVETALAAAGDADVLLWVVDVSRDNPEDHKLILEHLSAYQKPVVLAFNKIDLIPRSSLLFWMKSWAGRFPFSEIVPVSAEKDIQLDVLLDVLENCLPTGSPLFPEDSLTDLPVRFIAAELIREKVLRRTGDEIPYAVAVTIEDFRRNNVAGRTEIHAAIHVEKDSQKGIVIGKGGTRLKEIGIDARRDIESLLGEKVFLKLFVSVQKNWTKDTKAIARFGY